VGTRVENISKCFEPRVIWKHRKDIKGCWKRRLVFKIIKIIKKDIMCARNINVLVGEN
jgi:hypothetical protein